MKYILDAVVILIFVFALYRGYRKGFVKTLSKLVGVLAAGAVALMLCGMVAGFVFDSFMAKSIKSTITAQVPAVDTTSVDAGLDTVIGKLPGFISNALANQGITSGSDITGRVTGGIGNTAEAVAEQVTTQVIRPVAVSLLRIICFFVLFLILLVVALLLLNVLDKVCKLPGLKQLNGSLGLVAGAITGVLWVLLAAAVIQVIAASSAPDALISQQLVDQTVVTKWLIGINPIGSALRDVMPAVVK